LNAGLGFKARGKEKKKSDQFANLGSLYARYLGIEKSPQ